MLHVHESGRSWLSRLALEYTLGQSLPLLLGITLLLFVLLDACLQVNLAFGVLKVLNTDINPLGKDLAPHSLVDDNANSVWSYIEHTTCLAMVCLVNEALLEGSITLKVNKVSNFVHLQEGG